MPTILIGMVKNGFFPFPYQIPDFRMEAVDDDPDLHPAVLKALAAKISSKRLAPEDTPWGWSDAKDADAIIEAKGWSGFGSVCAYVDFGYETDEHDGRYPKVKAAYKLPFGKMIGGELKIVWRGVAAAMQRLNQTDITLAEKKKAYRTLAVYYKAFKKDLPAAPWAAKKSKAQASFLQVQSGDGTMTLLPAPRPHLPRTIWIFGFWDTSDVIVQMNTLLDEDSKTDILLMIDSRGGDVYGLNTLLGDIEACPVPVRTCIHGVAMSAAFVLASAGTKGKRSIMPNATGMIHRVMTWPNGGDIDDVDADMDEAKRLNEGIFKYLEKTTGTPSDEIQAELEKEKGNKVFMDAAAVVKFGAVDFIVKNFRDIIPKSSVTDDLQPPDGAKSNPEDNDE